MKTLLLTLLFVSSAWAGLPIPKDQNNTPIYTGQSKPYFSNAVTLTTTSYVALYTLPSTGDDTGRSWKSIVVRNPSSTRTVLICLGSAASCTVDSMSIPPALGLALDGLYFGPMNNITTVWGKLDSNGSVAPELTLW